MALAMERGGVALASSEPDTVEIDGGRRTLHCRVNPSSKSLTRTSHPFIISAFTRRTSRLKWDTGG